MDQRSERKYEESSYNAKVYKQLSCKTENKVIKVWSKRKELSSVFAKVERKVLMTISGNGLNKSNNV